MGYGTRLRLAFWMASRGGDSLSLHATGCSWEPSSHRTDELHCKRVISRLCYWRNGCSTCSLPVGTIGFKLGYEFMIRDQEGWKQGGTILGAVRLPFRHVLSTRLTYRVKGRGFRITTAEPEQRKPASGEYSRLPPCGFKGIRKRAFVHDLGFVTVGGKPRGALSRRSPKAVIDRQDGGCYLPQGGDSTRHPAQLIETTCGRGGVRDRSGYPQIFPAPQILAKSGFDTSLTGVNARTLRCWRDGCQLVPPDPQLTGSRIVGKGSYSPTSRQRVSLAFPCMT